MRLETESRQAYILMIQSASKYIRLEKKNEEFLKCF